MGLQWPNPHVLPPGLKRTALGTSDSPGCNKVAVKLGRQHAPTPPACTTLSLPSHPSFPSPCFRGCWSSRICSADPTVAHISIWHSWANLAPPNCLEVSGDLTRPRLALTANVWLCPGGACSLLPWIREHLLLIFSLRSELPFVIGSVRAVDPLIACPPHPLPVSAVSSRFYVWVLHSQLYALSIQGPNLSFLGLSIPAQSPHIL